MFIYYIKRAQSTWKQALNINKTPKHWQKTTSSSLLFNSCRSTGRRRYSATRPILCLALCFAPAQFHVSQLLLNCPLLCVLWSSSVSTTEGVHLRVFFVILLPAFLIVCPIQVHFLRVIVVSMESCSAMFHNPLLVILLNIDKCQWKIFLKTWKQCQLFNIYVGRWMKWREKRESYARDWRRSVTTCHVTSVLPCRYVYNTRVSHFIRQTFIRFLRQFYFFLNKMMGDFWRVAYWWHILKDLQIGRHELSESSVCHCFLTIS